MEVQWYPGHMAKARRMMEENIRLIDVVVELVDARIPLSTRNPDIDSLAANKARVLGMTKADLADPQMTIRWQEYFEHQGLIVCALDAKSRPDLRRLSEAIQKAGTPVLERNRKRGLLNRPLRAMITGIPNVGKSTLINSMTGSSSAKTGNLPGVTKGKQWIRTGKDLEFLDTPGLLWPKFEDPDSGRKIALIGSISDNVVDEIETALFLLRLISEYYPDNLKKTYALAEMTKPEQMLAEIAVVRGCLQKGGEPDLVRAAKLLLVEYRRGSIGRMTLEAPKE